MKEETSRKVFKIIPLIIFFAAILLCFYGWKRGIFTSQEKLEEFIDGIGVGGALVFTFIQAAQVLMPVLPGGIGYLAGVVLFGTWGSFLCSYIGICLGSVVAFLLAKYYGKPILRHLIKEKHIEKYEKWTSENRRFEKFFALMIFLPFAPDNLLCYVAGTTEMTFSRFFLIILTCKPFMIALYSMGLMAVFEHVLTMLK